MEYFNTIRALYTPLQPTVVSKAKEVQYLEHAANPRLRSLIYCYWELKTTTKLKAPYLYRVVTDGCIDIFFDLYNPSDNFVMGFCKKYTEFPIGDQFYYVGIRFLPTVFSQIYKVDASTMSNQFQDLSSVNQETASFLKNSFDTTNDAPHLVKKLNEYFLDIIQTKEFETDPRLYDAISTILKKQGVLNIASDLNTGISHRQLRRMFNYYIGDTPKTFSKVVKFQNILRAKPSSQSLKRNKLFYGLGYYDQAHFIKDFKNFYGVCPSKAFGR